MYGKSSPSHHLTTVVFSHTCHFHVLFRVFFLHSPALLSSPLSHLLPLHLMAVLHASQEKLPRILVQLHVQRVQFLYAPPGGRAHRDPGRPRAVYLSEGGEEVQAERPLEQKLRLSLELGEAEESHATQVAFGAAEEQFGPSLLAHGRQVVAAHQAEIGQHASLPVVGEVRRAGHELLQRHAGPVFAAVAGRQLIRSGRTAVAHVQSRLPRGAALHVLPLAQVARHRVP